jgi:osmotically-inducible protein OsmY
MKNIMYAVLAGVVLVSFMKNEQTATTIPIAQTQSGGAGTSDGRTQAEPNFNADENAVQLIRRSLSANKSLPTNGKDVKLIVSDGTITLRGIVKDEREKIAVMAMVRQYAGAKLIDDQLEVIN